MNIKAMLINLTLLVTPAAISAQYSGNIVYGQDQQARKNRYPEGTLYLSQKSVYLTDSTFLIEADVLANVIADSYVVTFGLSEEAVTVKECNEKIGKRTQNFISDLKKLGYSDSDIYLDMTTQNKVFGYITKGDTAEQYQKGFEIKKNVIIKMKSIRALDHIVVLASHHQIYDLVKVDYVVTDIAKIYNQLFQSATEVINQKKALYQGVTNARIAPVAQIYKEQFHSYYPDQLYKSYTAYESSEIYNYRSNFIKKDLRKGETFYYDKIDYSGFDKVINPSVPEPAVEFVLNLQIKYQTEKSKK